MKKFFKNTVEEFFLLLTPFIPYIVLLALFVFIPFTRHSAWYWVSWHVGLFMMMAGIMAFWKSRRTFKIQWIDNVFDIVLTFTSWVCIAFLLLKVVIIIPFLFLFRAFKQTRTITDTIIWMLAHTADFLLGIQIEYEGELYKGMSILAPNHTSSLDYFISVDMLGRRLSRIVAGKNLTKFPVFEWFLQLKCILVDRDDDDSKSKSARESQECINENIPLLIFFEGGRKRRSEDGLIRAKEKCEKGLFVLSRRNNIPIQPIVIVGAGDFKPPMKGEPLAKKWWKFQWYNKPTRIIVSFLPPIYPEGKDTNELIMAVRNAMEEKIISYQTAS